MSASDYKIGDVIVVRHYTVCGAPSHEHRERIQRIISDGYYEPGVTGSGRPGNCYVLDLNGLEFGFYERDIIGLA